MCLLMFAETFMTEAVALYDYKGRSDKELSFKKGAILDIRGQLSADWWHGSISASSASPLTTTTTTTTTTKLGYIPDKYIALRSCNKRFVCLEKKNETQTKR